MRGSSIPNVVSIISSAGHNVENLNTVLNAENEEASEPMLAWVQCEDCNKWFTLPQGVTTTDLPDVFVCGLRWWDCSLQKIKTGYKDDWCKKGAIKTNLVTTWLRQLTMRAAESMETSDVEDRNIEIVPNTMDAVHAGFEVTESLLENNVTPEPNDPVVNHTARLEGAARTRNKGLSDVCKYTLYLAQWYAAHVGRGKWQEARIAAHKDMLKLEMNRGKVAMFTTDMKSKTVPDKHKCEQGYRMGLKGMSLHGGMLNFCNDEGTMKELCSSIT